MCDQTEISYEDGEVVWVKLGSAWWPGEVVAADKLPPDVLASFRKPPIAVVKFFQEDSYEYVKNANWIYKYNCTRKHDFIKKGLDMFRAKHSHMGKFPDDVSTAEQRTDGDPDIVNSEEFQPQKKESYAGLFGSHDATPQKKGTPGVGKRGSRGRPPGSGGGTSKVPHPMLITPKKQGPSDYKVHILVQPSPPGTLQRRERLSDASSTRESSDELAASPATPQLAPTTPLASQAGIYTCHACNFTATRLNVIIMHNKTHSATFVPYTPSPLKKIKHKMSPSSLKETRKRDGGSQVEKRPKGRPRKINDGTPQAKKEEKAVSGRKVREDGRSPTKRKGTKVKEKEAKKAKTDIKNSLLADWSGDSNDSMNLLTSLKLTERDASTGSGGEEIKEVEIDLPVGNPSSPVRAEGSAAENEPEVKKSIEPAIEEKNVENPVSCFDFREEEDLLVESDVGRKIPRVNIKTDNEPSRKLSSQSFDSDHAHDRVKLKHDTIEKDKSNDITLDINNLLEETAMPELPSVPHTLKFPENFPETRAIKFPDKAQESGKAEERGSGNVIFKTKTFFRSRHSRSQDAIEKYVSDHMTGSKPPTYMEKSENESQSDIAMETEGLPMAVPDLLENIIPERKNILESPESMKVTKLAPKIQLKRMKAAEQMREKTKMISEISKSVKLEETKGNVKAVNEVETQAWEEVDVVVKSDDSKEKLIGLVEKQKSSSSDISEVENSVTLQQDVKMEDVKLNQKSDISSDSIILKPVETTDFGGHVINDKVVISEMAEDESQDAVEEINGSADVLTALTDGDSVTKSIVLDKIEPMEVQMEIENGDVKLESSRTEITKSEEVIEKEIIMNDLPMNSENSPAETVETNIEETAITCPQAINETCEQSFDEKVDDILEKSINVKTPSQVQTLLNFSLDAFDEESTIDYRNIKEKCEDLENTEVPTNKELPESADTDVNLLDQQNQEMNEIKLSEDITDEILPTDENISTNTETLDTTSQNNEVINDISSIETVSDVPIIEEKIEPSIEDQIEGNGIVTGDISLKQTLTIEGTITRSEDRIPEINIPTESDLQVAEALINLPASALQGTQRSMFVDNVLNDEKDLSEYVQEAQDKECVIEDAPIDSVPTEGAYEKQEEIIEQELVNSSNEISNELVPQQVEQDKAVENVESSIPVTILEDICDNELENKNLNAAESLVQMSESIETGHGKIITRSTDMFSISSQEEVVQSEEQSTEVTVEKTIESEMALLTNEPIQDLPVPKPFETTSSKLLRMLEEPCPPKPPKPSLKMITSKLMSPPGKEKILNFDVGNKGSNSSKIATVQPQKQKIIVRRTNSQKASLDNFGDTSQDKIVLSRTTSEKSTDGDSVQTFTIEQSPDSTDMTNVMVQPKVKKASKPPQKVVSKPQNTIITSTGALLQSASEQNAEDSMFDINSMPIVLSDEILTPENIDKMPIVISDGNVITQQQKPIPKEKSAKITADSKITEKAPPRAEAIITKPELKNILIKPVTEKSPSPNILSKSSKLRGVKQMLVVDQKTGEQKIIMGKHDPTRDTKPMMIKHTPTILTQPGSAGKVEKFIILPSSGQSTLTAGRRPQKIIMNPQTGRAHMILSKGTEMKQPELTPIQSAGVKMKSTPAKVIQNKGNVDLPGNTFMIITNAQGVQSRIVLTPEHEKVLFPKKSTMVSQQALVTSKGTILTPIQTTGGRTSIANVSGQSIITSKGQFLTTVPGNAIITNKGQVLQTQPKIITKQKTAIITSKGQLIFPGNSGGKRTIFTTAVPGQAILTSKGQLIAPQVSATSTTNKIFHSNVKTINSSNQQTRIIKGSPKTQTFTPNLVPATSLKMEKQLVQNISPKGQILARVPNKMTPSKEQMIIVQQKSGTIMQLTQSQFEQLQKIGHISHTQPKLVPTQYGKGNAKGTQKIIMHKYGGKSDKSNLKDNTVDPKKSIPSTVTSVKHKLPATQTHDESMTPMKKQKLRELLSSKAEMKPKLAAESIVRTNKGKQVMLNEQMDLDELLPSTAISTRKPDAPPPAQDANTRAANSQIIPGPVPVDRQVPEMIIDDASGQQSALGDSQILAAPGENFGGPPNSFFLCMKENGTLTPIDNQPLVLENNQLVPMTTVTPLQPEMPPLAPTQPVAAVQPAIPDAQPKESLLAQQQLLTLPADPQQNILINAGDQQILLDQQTFLSLLGGDGQQQLVTADGQQLVLQGNVQQLLAALTGGGDAGLVAGQQVLTSGQQVLIPGTQQQLLLPSAPEGYVYQTTVPQPSGNQDILAAALANTDVFQQETLISETLNISTGNADMLMEIESLSPNFQNLNANVSVHSHVSETSTTLNQPIMSPLEVPTKKEVKHGRLAGVQKPESLLGHNLEDSLAVLGVTAPSVPTSLELPITVTNPRIAPKTTNPLSLTCSVVYQNPTLLGSSLVSPGLMVQEQDPVLDYGASMSHNLLDKDIGLASGSRDGTKVEKLPGKMKGPVHFKKNLTQRASLTGSLPEDIFQKDRVASIDKSTKSLGPSCSMPCLDDSSSDSCVDDSSIMPAAVQRKSYSPISMPLLTEDTAEETSAGASKSMPILMDVEEDDTPSKEEIVESAPSILGMPMVDEKTMDTGEIAPECSDFQPNEDIIEMKAEDITDRVDEDIVTAVSKKDESVTCKDSEIDISEKANVIPEDEVGSVNDEALVIKDNISTASESIDNTMESCESLPEPTVAMPQCPTPVDDECISNGTVSDDSALNLTVNVNNHSEETVSSPLNDIERQHPALREMNNIAEPLNEELQIETSSTSTQNECLNPELLTPDTIPPTPPEPIENQPHFSDTSSNESDEIPIQPSISISHRAVENFSSLLNNNSDEHTSATDSNPNKNTRTPSPSNVSLNDNER